MKYFISFKYNEAFFPGKRTNLHSIDSMYAPNYSYMNHAISGANIQGIYKKLLY